MNVTFYDANPRLRRERGVNFGRVLARFVAGGREHDPVVVEFTHGDGARVEGVEVEVLNPEEFPGGVSESFMEAARRYCARTLVGEGRQVRDYEHEPPAQIGTAWSVDVEPAREH
ncbi:MAG: hypothetical protein AB7U81_02770 [Thiohalomonadaceae bacterium]